MNDKLDKIFELQEQLNASAGVEVIGMTAKERQDWMLKFAVATHQELAELIETLPYRWWQRSRRFNVDSARGEIIDLLHLVVSLCRLADLNAATVYRLYVRKHRLNLNRLRRRKPASE